MTIVVPRQRAVCRVAAIIGLLLNLTVELFSGRVAAAADGTASRVVAVAPLHAAGEDAVLRQLAVSLTDVVTALLGEDRNIVVVERKRIADVLTEQKLHASGLVDPATAVRLGKLLGADLVVHGSVVPQKDALQLTLNVVATAGQEVRGTLNLPLGRERIAEDLLAAGPRLAQLVDVKLAVPSPESLDDSPLGRVHLLRGMSCYAAKLPDQAIVHFLRAVHTDPRLIEARLWIARAYLESGESEKAKVELARFRTHPAAAEWQTESERLTQAIAQAEAGGTTGGKP